MPGVKFADKKFGPCVTGLSASGDWLLASPTVVSMMLEDVLVHLCAMILLFSSWEYTRYYVSSNVVLFRATEARLVSLILVCAVLFDEGDELQWLVAFASEKHKAARLGVTGEKELVMFCFLLGVVLA